MRAALDASAEPTELDVGFVGHSARVPLRPNESIGELRAKVAGAFGLTAPFDLVGPQGIPMRNNKDAASVLASIAGKDGASIQYAPQITVDANEETLLDLERVHEESAVMRWVLLQKVIAGLRTQIAEVAETAAESKRRAARFDEQILHERCGREAGIASARADIRGLNDNLEGFISRVQEEARSSLRESVADLTNTIDVAIGKQAAALREESNALKNSLRSEQEARQREADEALRRFDELRLRIQREEETRVEGMAEVRNSIASINENMTCAATERSALESRINEKSAALGDELRQACSSQESEVSKLRTSIDAKIGESQACFSKELASLTAIHDQTQARVLACEQHGDALSDLQKAHLVLVEDKVALDGHHTVLKERIDHVERSVGGSVDTHNAEMEATNARFDQIYGRMSVCEDGLTALQVNHACLAGDKTEMAAHHATVKERLDYLEGLFGDSADKHAQSLKSSHSALDSKLQQFNERMSAYEDMHSALQVGHKDAHALMGSHHASVTERLVFIERALGDSADKHSREVDALSTAHVKMTSDIGDTRAQLANHSKLHDLFAQETAARNSQHVSVDGRLDCIERILKDSAERHVTHDRLGAEVRAALEANNEVAEALEREQRLMLEHVNSELLLEGERREALVRRLNSIDVDIQRVRGHLPILFAPPKAFGC